MLILSQTASPPCFTSKNFLVVVVLYSSVQSTEWASSSKAEVDDAILGQAAHCDVYYPH